MLKPLSLMSVVIIAALICFIILTFFAISFLKQISSTVKKLEGSLSELDKFLNETLNTISPAIKNLELLEAQITEAVKELNECSKKISKNIEPLLIETQKTIVSYRELAQTMQGTIDKDVNVLIIEIQQFAKQLQSLALNIEQKLDATQELVEATRLAGKKAKLITQITTEALSGLAVQIASIATGVRTSLDFLSKNLITKGGDNSCVVKTNSLPEP